MTILIIDDNPSMHFIIRAALEFRGYRVIGATDGLQGLKRAQEEGVDLILLDFVIPKITGFHLCKMLKESPLTSSIPIILISSKAEKIGNKFIQMLGIDDFISKPFKTEELVQKVENILQKTREKIRT